MNKKYSQHFRVQWLNDSKFLKWLIGVERDDTKCYCTYCKCTMQWTHNNDALALWAEIASYRDATGENLVLVLTVLTLPHSNADVEHVFS